MGVLGGEAVDFLPRTPILMQFAAEYIGSNYAQFASDFRVLVRANEQCAVDFGIDQLSTISDPYRETQGFGSEITYRTDATPLSTHPLAETKDLSTLARPDPLVSERMKDRVDAVAAYKEQFGGRYSILGWVEGPAAEAADLRDVAAFMIDTVTDEPFACDLMDLCLENAIEFAEAQIRTGADTIGVGDAVASLVSPQTYESLILPREKRLVDAIQAAGAYVKLHICGNITHLLDGIAELGVDILDIDHMVDISTVRRKVGPGVVIGGNIDPAEGVYRGTSESIREITMHAYQQAGNPFMVNAGCEIPSGTPPENLKALCEPIEQLS
ncbi:MAG: uroporphyrinogen decarboxylase family protein [Phycisphaerae bacterium]|nr:uroporphyrinogen decarboxylase family protein [Phycisphaerae bacterium]